MPGTMLITGGGRGIGAATARLAAARGYAVAVNYVKDERAANAWSPTFERRAEPPTRSAPT